MPTEVAAVAAVVANNVASNPTQANRAVRRGDIGALCLGCAPDVPGLWTESPKRRIPPVATVCSPPLNRNAARAVSAPPPGRVSLTTGLFELTIHPRHPHAEGELEH